jgi:hypothetical protein
MPTKFIILFILLSCSTLKETPVPQVQKEFSKGEIILGTQLLTKIFDQEMAPLSCVPDSAEAELLLRTIHPHAEAVQDDIEAILDNESEIRPLVERCDQDCTCSYLDDLMREHLVVLSKELRASLNKKKKQKDLNSCLNYSRETFCASELYQELSREKADFKYDEGSQ